MSFNVGNGLLTTHVDILGLYKDKGVSILSEMSLWEKIKQFFCSTKQSDALKCIHKLYHHKSLKMTEEDIRDTFFELKCLASPGCRNKFIIDRYNTHNIYRINEEFTLSVPRSPRNDLINHDDDIWYDCEGTDEDINTYIHEDWNELLPEQPELLPEQPELLPEQPELLPEQPELLPEQPELLQEQPELLPEQPELLPEQPELLPEQPELLPEQSELLPEQSELLPEPPELLQEQPESLQEQPELLAQTNEFDMYKIISRTNNLTEKQIENNLDDYFIDCFEVLKPKVEEHIKTIGRHKPFFDFSIKDIIKATALMNRMNNIGLNERTSIDMVALRKEFADFFKKPKVINYISPDIMAMPEYDFFVKHCNSAN